MNLMSRLIRLVGAAAAALPQSKTDIEVKVISTVTWTQKDAVVMEAAFKKLFKSHGGIRVPKSRSYSTTRLSTHSMLISSYHVGSNPKVRYCMHVSLPYVVSIKWCMHACTIHSAAMYHMQMRRISTDNAAKYTAYIMYVIASMHLVLYTVHA